ncbi:MAG TPA: iron ABC transporter permease [Burkholderiaceae bacterium]|nr:iron ABC transporter permease [Burkholderiaceae bacterium]
MSAVAGDSERTSDDVRHDALGSDWPRPSAGRRAWPRLPASRRAIGLLVLALVCVVLAGVAAAVGATRIPLADVLSVALAPLSGSAGGIDSQHAMVLEQIRFPRVLLCVIVGASLGVAGAAMQGLFRNPLADPALIGASSGAALFVAMTIVLGNQWMPGFTRVLGPYALPAAAFVGCVAATWMVKRLATSAQGVSVGAMLLGGVAINALCEAAISALTFAASDEQLRNYTFWRMGTLAGASWKMGLLSAGCALVGMVLLLRRARALNVLTMGEEAARHAGVDVTRLSRVVVIAAALLVGASVASAGLVWFVGLVAPHGVRLLGGSDHRWVMPAAGLAGASLALAADAVSRIAVTPAELPLGVPLAVIGTPMFVALLMRARQQGRL